MTERAEDFLEPRSSTSLPRASTASGRCRGRMWRSRATRSGSARSTRAGLRSASSRASTSSSVPAACWRTPASSGRTAARALRLPATVRASSAPVESRSTRSTRRWRCSTTAGAWSMAPWAARGSRRRSPPLFSRYAMFGQKLQAAVTAPRWLLGKTWGEETMTLKLESRFDPSLIAAAARGRAQCRGLAGVHLDHGPRRRNRAARRRGVRRRDRPAQRRRGERVLG